MILRPGGIDIFYIDESNDHMTYVVTAVTIPFLRKLNDVWTIVWPDYLESAKLWRRSIKLELGIPSTKELHGVKLASGRGRYKRGKWNFTQAQASGIYRDLLTRINFIPAASVMSVAARRGSRHLYGKTKLEAAMYALMQRMRSQTDDRKTNAIVFFDEGHPEYRKLYRQAQVYLPTGSRFGGWGGGLFSKNLPLDMFTKDANEKISKHCHFTQAADMIAYAAFLKAKSENGELTEWQRAYNLGTLYDDLPIGLKNVRVSPNRDGIKRLY